MGIWKNLRAGAAFMREYRQDAMETVPRWARVVRVGRQVFGIVGVDVEIHQGRTPAHCIFASTRSSAAVHLGHPMSRDALVRSRHTPVSPRNLKRRRMSAAAAPASGKDVR